MGINSGFKGLKLRAARIEGIKVKYVDLFVLCVQVNFLRIAKSRNISCNNSENVGRLTHCSFVVQIEIYTTDN